MDEKPRRAIMSHEWNHRRPLRPNSTRRDPPGGAAIPHIYMTLKVPA